MIPSDFAEAAGQRREREVAPTESLVWLGVGMCALLAMLLLATPLSAFAHEGDEAPLPAGTGGSINQVYETPSGADRIIGSPDAGPAPQHSGDRGGALQFATLGAVAAATALIMWRIARAARQATIRAASRH